MTLREESSGAWRYVQFQTAKIFVSLCRTLVSICMLPFTSKSQLLEAYRPGQLKGAVELAWHSNR